jgi:hypothetical protein
MQGMKCYQANTQEIESKISELLSNPVYKPINQNVETFTKLHLNLAALFSGEIYFSIHSRKIDQLVHKGFFKETISVRTGQELTEKMGGDYLTFTFIDKNKGTICATWEHDEGSVFFGARSRCVY